MQRYNFSAIYSLFSEKVCNFGAQFTINTTIMLSERDLKQIADTTISLSSRLRQRPDHYTIRAGRNLPDKEFRYLRTVIVTAAVYRGFNSNLRIAPELSS